MRRQDRYGRREPGGRRAASAPSYGTRTAQASRIGGSAAMNGSKAGGEHRKTRSSEAGRRPPELKGRKGKILICPKQRDEHPVPRLVESFQLFRAHAMQFLAIAGRRLRAAERESRQPQRHYLRRCEGELDGLSGDACRSATATTRRHEVTWSWKVAMRTGDAHVRPLRDCRARPGRSFQTRRRTRHWLLRWS